MGILERPNRQLGRWLIADFDRKDQQEVRLRHGLVAGWVGIAATTALFVVKMALGLRSGSVSIVANAFHLLSHLANSVILVVSFWVTARPATAKTPFGHGRMEHVAPLVMAVFLIVSGLRIGEDVFHQAIDPHELHYWPGLLWILLVTVLVKQWLARFVSFLGERIESEAVLANAGHQNVDAVMTLAVVGGLVASHHFRRPQVDGYIGILVSGWLLFLGYEHVREAIVPLLGGAPSKALLGKIREVAGSVEGVEDVHEIMVHDYGSKYLISLHTEIPETYTMLEMHEIAERCEQRLAAGFGGVAVCHSDPLMTWSPEIQAVEDAFREVVASSGPILDYHAFRVIGESPERIIIAADIDAAEDIPEREFDRIAAELETRAMERIPNVAYCTFYVTPKFAY
ncbi:MAG: cation diffusion facilitator family transporter [Anaerolineae bacterium]|jgi:cation diffusion facilitator family transporter